MSFRKIQQAEIDIRVVKIICPRRLDQNLWKFNREHKTCIVQHIKIWNLDDDVWGKKIFFK